MRRLSRTCCSSWKNTMNTKSRRSLSSLCWSYAMQSFASFKLYVPGQDLISKKNWLKPPISSSKSRKKQKTWSTDFMAKIRMHLSMFTKSNSQSPWKSMEIFKKLWNILRKLWLSKKQPLEKKVSNTSTNCTNITLCEISAKLKVPICSKTAKKLWELLKLSSALMRRQTICW